MQWQVQIAGKDYVVRLPDYLGDDRDFVARVGEKSFTCRWQSVPQILTIITERGELHLKSRSVQIDKFPGDSESTLQLEYWNPSICREQSYRAKVGPFVPGGAARKANTQDGVRILRAPMTGKVLSIAVANAEGVENGQTLLVIEAMKMENKIFAPQAGVIAAVKVKAGQSVTVGQELLSISKA